MHPDLKLSIAVLNGYPRHSRDRFDREDVGHPHDLYAAFLRSYVPAAQLDVIFVADVDSALPAGTALTSYDAVIWTGSDLTLYHTDDERVTRQIELARAIFEAGIPMYGSCWGVQMAAYAAGGDVRKNPRGREWGIARDIRLTDTGREHPLMRHKPDVFDGFIMHLDEVVTLPAKSVLLATNEHTHVQALEVRHKSGIFWATQYHPEYTFYEMARLIRARAAPLVKEGFFDQKEAVLAYARDMFVLADNPADESLRQQFKVDDTLITAEIRQAELRNWIDCLVIPSLKH